MLLAAIGLTSSTLPILFCAMMLGAILWWDSFDVYGTTIALITKWWSGSGSTGLSLVAGAFGSSRALNSIGNISTQNSKVFANTSVIGVSFWWKPSGAGNDGNGFILGILDGITAQLSLSIDTSRKLSVRRGATTLGVTAIAPLTGAWIHVELKATIHATLGQIELRLNGSSVDGIPQTAANLDTNSTANNFANGIQLMGNIGGVSWAIDDLIVWDTTGAAPRNDWLGPVRINTSRPNAAGTNAQWTATGAADGQTATANDPPDATKYISSNTSGHKSTFNVTDVASGPTVKGAMIRSSGADPSGGAAQYKNLMLDGGVERQGATISPGIADAYSGDVYATAADGTEWNTTKLTNLEIGVIKV